MAPLPNFSRVWWSLLLASCTLSVAFAQMMPRPNATEPPEGPGAEEEPFPNNCTRAVPLYLPPFQVEELLFPGLPCITTLHAQPWKRLLLEFANVNIDASVFECELAGATFYSLSKGLLNRVDRICGTLNSSRAFLTEENVAIVTFGTTIPSSESTFSVRVQVTSGQGYTSNPLYSAPTPTQVLVSSYPYSNRPQYTSAQYSAPPTQQPQQPQQQYYQQQNGHGGYYSGSVYSPPSTSAPYQPPQRPSYSQYPYPNSYQPPPYSVTFTSTTTPSPLPSETPPSVNQQPPPSFSRNFPPSGPLFLANENTDVEGDNFISKTNYRPVAVYQQQIPPPINQGSDFFNGNCNETDWHVSKTDPVYYYWGKPQAVGVYPEESEDLLQYTDDGLNEITS